MTKYEKNSAFGVQRATVLTDGTGSAVWMRSGSVGGLFARTTWTSLCILGQSCGATDQPRAFITSYSLGAGFRRRRKPRLRYGLVVSDIVSEEQADREKERARLRGRERAPAGRQAVQPLPALGFLGSLKYASYF